MSGRRRGTRAFSKSLRGTTRIEIGWGTLSLPYELMRREIAGVIWYDAKLPTLPGVRASGRTTILARENVSAAAIVYIEACFLAARKRGWKPPMLPEGATMRVPIKNVGAAPMIGGVAAVHLTGARQRMRQQMGIPPEYGMTAANARRAAAEAAKIADDQRSGTGVDFATMRASTPKASSESVSSENGGSSAVPWKTSED